MGHITNPIGFRLALIAFWQNVFVTTITKYKKIWHKTSILKQMCKNYFTNYSVPEFTPGTLRNDKKLEQKDRKIQTNIITNSFVENNMIYANTAVILTKNLEIQNSILDAGQLDKKTNEIKDVKKMDSSYLKPKTWKRHLARSLLVYKNALQINKKRPAEYYKTLTQRKININTKSFKLAFRTKYIVQQFEKQQQKKFKFNAKLKTFLRPRKYILKSGEILKYYLVLKNSIEEENPTKIITLDTKSKIKSYLNMAKLAPLKVTSYTQIKPDNTNTVALTLSLNIVNLFTLIIIKNEIMKSKLNHGYSMITKSTKQRLETSNHNASVIQKRLRTLKRYPVILYQFFAAQKNKLHIISGQYKFNVLKCFIKGFNPILQMCTNVRVSLLFMFKELLMGLFTLIGNIPQMFVLSMLTTLILQETAQKHTEVIARRDFFSFRFFIYQNVNLALLTASHSIENNLAINFSFIGLHTRNMSANMLKNYILQKLGQYFTIQEILKPILFDLKTSPLLHGFKIIVAGRITRKERAAYLIKKFSNLPLNKKSAQIDYSTGSRIQKFGIVGIKVFLYKKTTKVSYYNFKFINNIINVI